MIRTGRPQKTDTSAHADRPMTCWGQHPVCDAIAFELPDGRLFVFPKGQLVCAEYSGAAPLETVRLTFSTHEAHVLGHGLRTLAVAVQTGAVSWVKCFSAVFGTLINRDVGHVTGITIWRIDEAPDSVAFGKGANPTAAD